MRGNLLRCVGFFSMCLLVSGVAAAKDVGDPWFVDVPSECDATTGNVVVNCGFELNVFAPWVQSGDTSFTSIQPRPHTGVYDLYTGPVNSLGFITQMVPVTVGQTYNLVFNPLRGWQSMALLPATRWAPCDSGSITPPTLWTSMT